MRSYGKPCLHVLNGWLLSGGRMGLSAARKVTPLSSTAVNFHDNTSLNPGAHNHAWTWAGEGRRCSDSPGRDFYPCQHHVHNAFQDVKLWLFLSSRYNYTPFSSFHGAGVSISLESLFFHLQMLVLMDSFHHQQSAPASCSIPPLTGRLKPRMSYILPYLNLHCPPCLLPGRDMKYWLLSSGPAAPSLH